MKKILIGNWKLNCSLEKIKWVSGFRREDFKKIECCVAVPYTHITTAKTDFPSFIKVCAQDCSKYEEGAYTGEVSAKMLKEIGVEYVIVGHSERRRYFDEDNSAIGEKVKRCLLSDIKVVLCVGESEEERNKQLVLNVIEEQIKSVAEKLSDMAIIRMDVAYEPVWAIGTGKIPTLHQIEYAVKHLKTFMNANRIVGRILYGGSVSLRNFKLISEIAYVDGLLVGNASLEEDFIEMAREIK
ncbi:triose-phosphate isomerase [Hamiltosporidium tvaerminnensis]|uniref:Triosephosphate isomerase n=2 Tax=Hamiltosporidium TaxID=1176354 RepID=A0A4V2JUN3_9MICR|nr:triose-phosphate isomerase [Hamiltosporidium tvaerminnensis]TBU00862.1 triose-phosphate isomerase [Hamiltosporidium magnivora]